MGTITKPAKELVRGDYILRTRENGKSFAGTSCVQRVEHDDDNIIYTISAGANDIDIIISANDAVTVEA